MSALIDEGVARVQQAQLVGVAADRGTEHLFIVICIRRDEKKQRPYGQGEKKKKWLRVEIPQHPLGSTLCCWLPRSLCQPLERNTNHGRALLACSQR